MEVYNSQLFMVRNNSRIKKVNRIRVPCITTNMNMNHEKRNYAL